MVEHVEVDVSAGSQEKLQLQSECKGHESAVHPQRRDRGTITSVCVGRVILQLLPDVSNPRLPKCCLRLLRLEITGLDSSQQLKRTGKEMQRKKPVTRLLLWLNSWAVLLRVVIVSFGLTLTKKWGKKKKKRQRPNHFFFFFFFNCLCEEAKTFSRWLSCTAFCYNLIPDCLQQLHMHCISLLPSNHVPQIVPFVMFTFKTPQFPSLTTKTSVFKSSCNFLSQVCAYYCSAR